MAALEIDPATRDLMLKLRKGAAASLNARKLEHVFEHLSGWRLERITAWKQSGGGQLLPRLVPEVQSYFRDWHRREDDRVRLRADDEANVAALERRVFPRLQALAAGGAGPADKSILKQLCFADLRLDRYPADHGRAVTDVNFILYAKVRVVRITAPDGQEFEVFGDHVNGALHPRTFQDFYAWAVEHTDFMIEVCDVLGMEPPEPKEDASAPYVPPPTAHADQVAVWERLRDVTADLRDELAADIAAQAMTGIDGWRRKALAAPDQARRYPHGIAGLVVSQHRGRDTGPGELLDGWENTVRKLARDVADDMQRRFVARNCRKFAGILAAKGNLVSQDVVLGVNAGAIVGRMTFAFADGSSFTARTSAVMAWAPVSNYPFFRLPTTFHDAVLPTGEPMANPSEETMNEVFAKATGPVLETAGDEAEQIDEINQEQPSAPRGP